MSSETLNPQPSALSPFDNPHPSSLNLIINT